MDLEYFLKERTKFVRYFYENAARPFERTIKLIEEEKEPFVPPYSEGGAPAFFTEWLEARDALVSVGLAAVSMLSSSLQLFLSSWTDRIDYGKTKLKRTDKKKGWLNAYKKIMVNYDINLSDCPANWELIEQVVLVRNLTQHPDNLTALSISYSKNYIEKYPSPYFISEKDRLRLEQNEQEISWWMMPNVHIDQLKIEELSQEIEKLCSWLEAEYLTARYGPDYCKNGRKSMKIKTKYTE